MFKHNHEFGRLLMSHLSATDVAVFTAAIGVGVQGRERREFPVRDFGPVDGDVQSMISNGYTAMLMGRDSGALLQRIADPVTYCEMYGRRKLAFIVIFMDRR